MVKRKRTKEQKRSIKHYTKQKTKDRVTRTVLKTGGELRCSGCVSSSCSTSNQGRIQDFKLGGAHFKKLPRAEGDAKFLGYFVWKITILRKKIISFPILVGSAPGAPLPGSAPGSVVFTYWQTRLFINDPTGLYTCLHFDQAGFQKHLLTSCFRV